MKLIQAKLKEARIDCLQVRNDSIELFDLPKTKTNSYAREETVLVNVLLVVRFKPVEKKDKFLMAFNHCIKSPVNEEIRKYKNIIHVV